MQFFQNFYDVMLAKGRWELIAQGLGTTILISVCAILIGTLLGCLFALMKISKSRILHGVAGVYTTVFGPLGWDKLLIAIIGFGINSGAYVTEIIRAGIEGVDIGQTEAGRSLGLSRTQTMLKIVLPQAVKAVLPTYTSEFIALIKETSVASFIAVMDLNKAGDMIRNASYNAWYPLFTVAVIYLILTFGLTKLFGMIERRLARSDRG